MKILFDHQIFGRQRYGGISRYFYELVRELAAYDGVDVDLFMGLHINAYDFESVEGIRRSGHRRPRIRFTGRAFAALNDFLMRRHTRGNRPDIHHATYFQPTDTGAGLRVLTVYDMIQERFPELFSRQDKTSQHKLQAIADADAVIAISEHTRRDIIEICGTSPDKIRTIHLGNSLQVPATGPAQVDAPYILYVGERYAYKNFPLLLREYAAAGDIHREWKLVAFGGPSWSPAERAIIEQAGIADRVLHMSGADDLLANLYKHARVFVYPSLYEGFGIPPLEAMFHGCPIVAGRGGSIPEVIGDDAAQYFTDDLTFALRRVLTDEALRERLVAAGYKREKQFSWANCAARTYEYYREISG